MTRRLLLAAGVAVLAAAWLGPLPGLARAHFSAHMTMHMAVVAIAAPLLALALSGSRYDPTPAIPHLLSPIPASLIELVVVWSWHAPALHHLARSSGAGLIAEQSTFVGSGLLLWLAAFGGGVRSGPRAAAGVVALLLTSMHMTLLGALLAMSPRPLYAHGGGAALDDQHLGGAIMLLVGGVAYLAGGLWLSGVLLHERTAAQRGAR